MPDILGGNVLSAIVGSVELPYDPVGRSVCHDFQLNSAGLLRHIQINFG